MFDPLAIHPVSPDFCTISYPFVPHISPAFSKHIPQFRAVPEQLSTCASFPSASNVFDEDAHPTRADVHKMKISRISMLVSLIGNLTSIRRAVKRRCPTRGGDNTSPLICLALVSNKSQK